MRFVKKFFQWPPGKFTHIMFWEPLLFFVIYICFTTYTLQVSSLLQTDSGEFVSRFIKNLCHKLQDGLIVAFCEPLIF